MSATSLWFKETLLQPDGYRPVDVPRLEKYITDYAPTPPFSQRKRVPGFSGAIQPLETEQDAYLGWRVVEQGRVLELMRFGVQRGTTSMEQTHGEDLSHEAVPVRIGFPTVILPEVGWFEERSTGVLHCVLLLASGTVMRISFEQPALFYTNDEFDSQNCFQYRIRSLRADRAPVTVRSISADHLVVGCTDGSMICVDLPSHHDQQDGPSGEVNEVLLEANSLISQVLSTPVRLLAHTIRRHQYGYDVSDAVLYEPMSVMEQALDITTYTFDTLDTFIFSVCRDRKLRVWSFVRRACVQVCMMDHYKQQYHVNLEANYTPLPAQPRKSIWLLDGPAHDKRSIFHLLVAMNDIQGLVFLIYRGKIDYTGQLESLDLVHYQPCRWTYQSGSSSETYSLVDVAFDELPSPASVQAKRTLRLWTLWQRKSEVKVCFTFLTLPKVVEATILTLDDDTEMEQIMREDEETELTPESAYLKRRFSYVGLYGETWFDVIMTSSETLDLKRLSDEIENSSNAVAETFLRHIFAPGRFSRATIEQALEIYRRDIDPTFLEEDATLGVTLGHNLEEQVCHAISSRLVLPVYEPTGAPLLDELDAITKSEWFRFYTLCTQLNQETCRPLGISAGGRAGIISIVRTDTISVIRTCSMPELLWHHMTGEYHISSWHFLSEEVLRKECPMLADAETRRVLEHLFKASRLLAEQVNQAMLRQLEMDARMLQYEAFEDSFVGTVRDTLQQCNLDFNRELSGHLKHTMCATNDPTNVLSKLLDAMDMHTTGTRSASSDAVVSSVVEAAVATVLHEHVTVSYQFAQQILLLAFVWVSITQERSQLQAGCKLIQRCIEILHRYSNIMQLSTQRCIRPVGVTTDFVEPSSKEAGGLEDDFIRQFSGLNVANIQRINVYGENRHSISITHLLMRRFYPLHHHVTHLSDDLVKMVTQLYDQMVPRDTEKDIIHVTARIVIQLLSLGLTNEAHRLMQDVPKTPIIAHLRGIAFLRQKCFSKAKDCFILAGSHFANAPSSVIDTNNSSALFAQSTDGADSGLQPISNYYVCIADYFAEQGHHEYALDFCQLALTYLPKHVVKSKEAMPVHARVFRHAIALSMYDLAYTALMTNPDLPQRHAFVRHLVAVLCEDDEVDKLCAYAFLDLQTEVEQTLQFKARNTDVFSGPNYYRIMYSYYVMRGDYRSAARAMYSYARRIQKVAPTSNIHLEAISSQAQAYLAAINALHLVDPKNAWIVIEDDENMLSVRKRRRVHLPKHEHLNVGVVELRDIRREYAVTLAKLKIMRLCPEMEGSVCTIDAGEMIQVFIQKGQYSHAFQLAEAIGLDMSPIFVSFIRRCTRAAYDDLMGRPHPHETETALLDSRTNTSTTRGRVLEGSYSARMWNLLKQLLDRYDTAKTQYRYRKLALESILSSEYFTQIPAWLVKFYADNQPEVLIRMYLKYGILGEAARQASLHIEKELERARKSAAKNIVDIQEGRTITSTYYLPYTLLDTLMKALEEQVGKETPMHDEELDAEMLRERSETATLYRRLSSQLQAYFAIIEKQTHQQLAIREKQKTIKQN